jgi:hypothetical protein
MANRKIQRNYIPEKWVCKGEKFEPQKRRIIPQTYLFAKTQKIPK